MPVVTPQPIDQLNQHPLNREAKRWLLEAGGDEPREDQQYLLQLMWWGVTEGNLHWGNEQARILRDRLHDLLLTMFDQKNQAYVLRLMAVGVSQYDDDTNLGLSTLQSAQNPKDAAWRALDAFHNATSALPFLDPTYPTE